MLRHARLVALLIVGVAIVASVGVPLWMGQHKPAQSPAQPKPTPTPEAKTIDIQHALFNRNDIKIGTPSPGYVYVDFSLLIMNCGYDNFAIAPSLFLLDTGGTTYAASNATARLPTPLNQTVLSNGQIANGEIAYLIPADFVSAIPLTPLVYKNPGYTINWVSNW